MKGKLILLSSLVPVAVSAGTPAKNIKTPNVIYIMADDLGLGDLGCYGQRQIKTPAIDSLARGGMVFSQHYSGSTVSAPSRASLMTGKHTGHSTIRGNNGYRFPDGCQYDEPLTQEDVTLGDVFHSAGYTTACFGKWGMGGPGTAGAPEKKGFDKFFGYLSQLNAHRYYPQFLWDDTTKVKLDGKVYSHDLIMDKALDFIDNNSEKPFFIYLTPTIPHADMKIPDGELGEYENMFFETPFPGGGYTACAKPRATFAAMVSRLDRDVRRIMDLLHEKGIDDNTIIIFTSDNGTHAEGGHDPYYFASSGGFRGMKRDLYEGGIRTPFIVYWKDMIKGGSVSDHVSAFWDFMPTMCDVIGAQKPQGIDGMSYFNTLTGTLKQKSHDYLYFEFHEMGGRQAVIKDNWKLIKLNAKTPENSYYELYNLSADPTEQHNMAAQQSEKVEELNAIMRDARTENKIWNF